MKQRLTTFFFPGTSSHDEADRAYLELRTRVDETQWGPLDDLDDGRMETLVHVDDSGRHEYQVGKFNSSNGLEIVALFGAFGPCFYVCSYRSAELVVDTVSLKTNDVVHISMFDEGAE